MKRNGWAILLVLVVLALSGEACSTNQPMAATGGATRITDLGFTIPKDAQGRTAEQKNIVGRLKVTTDPTKVYPPNSGLQLLSG